jgi:hypothetical protein
VGQKRAERVSVRTEWRRELGNSKTEEKMKKTKVKIKNEKTHKKIKAK